MREPGSRAAMAATASATPAAASAASPAARAAAAVASAGRVAASPGMRDGGEVAGLGGERAQEALDVLGAQHPADEVQRPRRQARERLGERLAGGRVVAAVEPELGGAGGLDQRAVAQALEPGRPFRLRDRGGAGGLVGAERAQRGERDAGVRHLMRADQAGAGQVEQAGLVEEGHAAVLLPDLPVAVGDRERRRRPHRRGPRSRRAPRAAASRRRRGRRASGCRPSRAAISARVSPR